MKINEEVLNNCISESDSYDILIDILNVIEDFEYYDQQAKEIIRILRKKGFIEY